MIDAVLFDLDGTLVETEQLKALSYARAAAQLRPHAVDEKDVLGFFTQVVGLSRREVAMAILDRFDLHHAAATRQSQYGVDAPWQAYVQLRLSLYEEMLFDPATILSARYPHNIMLLDDVRGYGVKTGLATMSYRPQAHKVLGILGLTRAFDFIAARDDVEHGKPDPEIYLLVARELGVEPSECLVIEDSPTGVKAGLAAGMNVIAVTTLLTRPLFAKSNILDQCWVVEEPAALPAVVRQRIEAHQKEYHGGVTWNLA